MPQQPLTLDDLAVRFSHHAPTGPDAERHARLRLALWTAARSVVEITPGGREQSLAITHLEEAMFWANAAVAREP